KVIGEIWSVDPEKLRDLDEFEGLPPGALEGDEYRRRRVMVEPLPGPEDGSEWDSASTSTQPEEAWVWEWTGQTESASLFTSIGCLAILSFTVGTKALLAGLVFLFPKLAIPEGVHFWAWVAGLILATGVGGYSLHMATKRREPGHPFQIMTGMAVLLLGMYGLVALLITLFALLSG
ncbi:MAG: gamma-glutamylcyclotransferase, partial [Haloferula sp.]